MTFNLYVTYSTGAVRLVAFETPLLRALVVILLSSQPVSLRLEDRS